MDGYGSQSQTHQQVKTCLQSCWLLSSGPGGHHCKYTNGKTKTKPGVRTCERKDRATSVGTSTFTNYEERVTHHAREGERFTSNNQGLRLASMRTSKPYSSARGNTEQRMHFSGERAT